MLTLYVIKHSAIILLAPYKHQLTHTCMHVHIETQAVTWLRGRGLA